jgi:purine nucleoside phosphorylase
MTYHEDDAKFTSVTQPFDKKINDILLKTLRREQKLRSDNNLQLVLWLSQGPHYETEAEVTAAERMGADCCGMTSPREAKLCAELGVPYSCLTIASNWAAGRHPGDPNMALSHEEVAEMSKTTTGTILACLVDLLKDYGSAAGSDSAAPSPKKQKRK